MFCSDVKAGWLDLGFVPSELQFYYIVTPCSGITYLQGQRGALLSCSTALLKQPQKGGTEGGAWP